MSSAADRLALVEAAVGDVPGLEASRLEIDRGGESYTADTLAELRQAGPEDELFLIVGWDVAGELATWERHERSSSWRPWSSSTDPARAGPPGLDDESAGGGGGDRPQPGDLQHRPAGPGRRRPAARLSGSRVSCALAYGPGVCTLEADDNGPLGSLRRLRPRRGDGSGPGERLRRLRQRRRLVREELLTVAVLFIALVATLVVLGLQWLGQRSVGHAQATVPARRAYNIIGGLT